MDDLPPPEFAAAALTPSSRFTATVDMSSSVAARKPRSNARNLRKRHYVGGGDHGNGGIDQQPPSIDRSADGHSILADRFGFFHNVFQPNMFTSAPVQETLRGPPVNRIINDVFERRCPCMNGTFPELCCLNDPSGNRCQLHRLFQGTLPLLTSYRPVNWIPFAQHFSSSLPAAATASTPAPAVYPSTSSSSVHQMHQQVPVPNNPCIHCAHHHATIAASAASPFAALHPRISITHHLVPQPASPMSFVPFSLERVPEVIMPFL
ncbi:unnamed protein product [Soboliphyme baturini]|uniref:Uncharacterized protein n=1 Tax=Soboliphyme baturini TaxID=241478 RepID=A0A183ITZ1_9BILA|nr:unnamed protein product [Soboliphyme baturini]